MELVRNWGRSRSSLSLRISVTLWLSCAPIGTQPPSDCSQHVGPAPWEAPPCPVGGSHGQGLRRDLGVWSRGDVGQRFCWRLGWPGWDAWNMAVAMVGVGWRCLRVVCCGYGCYMLIQVAILRFFPVSMFDFSCCACIAAFVAAWLLAMFLFCPDSDQVTSCTFGTHEKVKQIVQKKRWFFSCCCCWQGW